MVLYPFSLKLWKWGDRLTANWVTIFPVPLPIIIPSLQQDASCSAQFLQAKEVITVVKWCGLVCLLVCLFVCFFFVCAIQSSNRFNDCLNQWFQNVNGIHVVFLQPFYALFMIWFANYQHWHGQGWLLATCQMFWVDADGQTPALTPTKMNSSHLPRNRNPKGNSSEPTIDF